MRTPPTRSHDAVPLRPSPRASPVPGRVAVAGGVVFVLAAVVAGLLYPGYDPTREGISALASTPSPSAAVMIGGFLALAAGTTAAGVALWARLRGSTAGRTGAVLVLLAGAGMVVAGLARQDCSELIGASPPPSARARSPATTCCTNSSRSPCSRRWSSRSSCCPGGSGARRGRGRPGRRGWRASPRSSSSWPWSAGPPATSAGSRNGSSSRSRSDGRSCSPRCPAGRRSHDRRDSARRGLPGPPAARARPRLPGRRARRAAVAGRRRAGHAAPRAAGDRLLRRRGRRGGVPRGHGRGARPGPRPVGAPSRPRPGAAASRRRLRARPRRRRARRHAPGVDAGGAARAVCARRLPHAPAGAGHPDHVVGGDPAARPPAPGVQPGRRVRRGALHDRPGGRRVRRRPRRAGRGRPGHRRARRRRLPRRRRVPAVVEDTAPRRPPDGRADRRPPARARFRPPAHGHVRRRHRARRRRAGRRGPRRERRRVRRGRDARRDGRPWRRRRQRRRTDAGRGGGPRGRSWACCASL